MNKVAKELINKINEKTEFSPLIYISRDIERSLGLEKYLNNYYQICSENSYIYQQLKDKTKNAYLINNIKNLSTLEIINNKNFKNIINRITKNLPFYAQFFQFNEPAKLKIEAMGGRVINNSALLNRKFESKFNQFKLFVKNNIPQPYGFIEDISKLEYELIKSKIKQPKFIVQTEKAHTGSGTYFIESKIDFDYIKSKLLGNYVKISKYIESESYTLNCCIYQGEIFVNNLQYQITGIQELTNGKGTTVGNDWYYAQKISRKTQKKIIDLSKKIGEILKKDGYKGLFGIDLLITENEEIFILEVNARQSANIPMETKLEIENEEIIPLTILHISEFMNIYLNINSVTKYFKDYFNFYKGSQVFLRSKKNNTKIVQDLKSGIYRMQGDVSAFKNISINLKKDHVLFIDEDKDTPLIWEKDAYSIDDFNKQEYKKDGILILNSLKESTKNINEEISRIQLKRSIISNNKLPKWIIQTLQTIEDSITI